MPVGAAFTQENGTGRRSPVGPEMQKLIQAKLARSPGIVCIDEDAGAQKMLEPYRQAVSVFYRQKAAQAPEDLEHVRLPQAGTELAGGSQVAPLVADAMLWKVRALGLGADAALVNAGAVRGSIAKGDVSVGQLADVLPFGDRLVVCRVSGRDLKKLLNAGIDRALSSAENDGAFPYVSGLRYTADRARPAGKKLVRVELQNSRGRWITLADAASCRIVTNNYLIAGADGYGLFPGLARQKQVTEYGDAEAFIEYARMKGELRRLSEQRIKLKGS
jgi:5'-nucleotidase